VDTAAVVEYNERHMPPDARLPLTVAVAGEVQLLLPNTCRAGYSKKYRKYDPDAWREDGSGYLQRSCAVLVHDYADVGVHGSGSGAFGTATRDSAASLQRSNTPPPTMLGGTGKKAGSRSMGGPWSTAATPRSKNPSW